MNRSFLELLLFSKSSEHFLCRFVSARCFFLAPVWSLKQPSRRVELPFATFLKPRSTRIWLGLCWQLKTNLKLVFDGHGRKNDFDDFGISANFVSQLAEGFLLFDLWFWRFGTHCCKSAFYFLWGLCLENINFNYNIFFLLDKNGVATLTIEKFRIIVM